MSSKGKNHGRKMKPGYQVIGIIHRFIELISRGILSLVAYFCGPAESQPPIKDLTLLHSASALALKIRNKQLTSVEVVQAYVDRIKEIQPVLNCVVEDRFEKALEEAKKCDEMLKSPNAPTTEILAKEKPFLGVPFTTKDCVSITGMKQTAGLVARKNTVANRDAESIRLMRSAGAIVLATTNVSELAMWWESSNCLYGTSRNPYNTRHIVGGSSGGEGCLNGAAGTPFGLGTDIGGSIRMPCFFNGIFGHKPSRGIVCHEGQYPYPECEDQARLLGLGPMCRYAQDLSPILKVLADANVNMLKLDQKVDISKVKFYYMEDGGGELLVSRVDPEIQEALRRVVHYLERAHKVKPTKVQIKKMRKSAALWFANMTINGEKRFSWEMTNRTGQLNVWWELARWFTFTSPHTLIGIITAMFEKFGMAYGSEEHTKFMQQSRELHQEFRDMLGEDGVFLYPTHPTAAPMHYEPLIKPFNFCYTAIMNVLGLPATACPLGLNKQGLPIGIQIIGGLYQDHLTIAVAEELERGFGGWVPPAIIA